MRVDDEEFKSFVNNVEFFLVAAVWCEENLTPDRATFNTVERSLQRQVAEYKKIIENKNKKSKWKQLNLYPDVR